MMSPFNGGDSGSRTYVVPNCALWVFIGLFPQAATVAVCFGGTPADTLEVIVQTVGEQNIRGELIALTLDEGASLRVGEQHQRIAFEELVRVFADSDDSTGRPPRGEPDAPPSRFGSGPVLQFELAGGDFLRGEVVESRDDATWIATADFGRIRVPLDAMVRIITSSVISSPHADTLKWFNRPGPADAPLLDDVILLSNGDMVRGFIAAVNEEGIRIERAGADARVAPFRLVLGARFAQPVRRVIADLHCTITGRDSGAVTVTDIELVDGVFKATTHYGSRIRVAASRLRRIDVFGGRWTWLSQEVPVTFEHVPMLDLAWEYRANRNVLNLPITVEGRTFERGFGVHSRSRLAFELKGHFREFVTHFGMDDRSGPLADVTVVVQVDGEKRFERAGVKAGKIHGPVRLDLRRAHRLELIVDFGENGDLQDRFNWVEPGLIR